MKTGSRKSWVGCAFAAWIMALTGCGSASVVDDGSKDTTLTQDIASDAVVIGTMCISINDCTRANPCISTVACTEGFCEYTYMDVGAACSEGCAVNGVCNANGDCELTESMICPEADGNPCTQPWCDPESGECAVDEKVVADGAEPYISNCWDGIICIDGTPDHNGAAPTAHAKQCEEKNAELDPFGCIEKVLCVDSEEICKSVQKENGQECWIDNDTPTSVCSGHSCNSGECVPDVAFQQQCTEADYFTGCTSNCQTCTLLECHWIPDPNARNEASSMVRYCKPVAQPGLPCEDGDPCTVNDKCAAASYADGPLGKEILGKCVSGVPKDKDTCLAELGKPDLPCILAGISCDSGAGGCIFKQTTADQWCWPPEWKCFDKGETYCTHLDTGERWNPDTGCNLVWLNAEFSCDDNNPCTIDSCSVGEQGVDCLHDLVNGAPCDDDNPCTLGEYCVTGMCAGSIKKCADDDDNPCNDFACEPASGECLPSQVEGVFCDDSNLCTVNDKCSGGLCLGVVASCDDKNVCTDDLCIPQTGCEHLPNELPCDDNDASTLDDNCSGGICVGGEPIDCDDENICTEDSADSVQGCLYSPQPGLCSDGNACTSNDYCEDAKCVGGTLVECNDNNACTEDTCDPTLGCLSSPNTAPCDDGNKCTTGDTCSGGACQGTSILDCNDDNPCTDDMCNPEGGCVHSSNSAGCDDGDPCTTGDHCENGSCLTTGALNCSDDNSCTLDSCSLIVGCIHESIDGACSDGNACTTGDLCSSGKCVAQGLLDCNDGNSCTDDACNPDTGCLNSFNNVVCEDNDLCTANDKCVNGICVGLSEKDCGDGNSCTIDVCFPAQGCMHINTDGACDDDNTCTLNDTCVNGECVGSEQVDCDDANPCTNDSCNPASGCVHSPNQISCDDGNACTVNDKCADSICQGQESLVCNDNNICTDDSCEPGSGCNYLFNQKPCDDQDQCTVVDMCSGGLCIGSGEMNCDDGNICTNDGCVPQAGCVHSPIENPCNDNNACTPVDKCQNGMCVGTGELPCNDNNICTDDTCDPTTGCAHSNNSVSCSDGKTCYNGVCQLLAASQNRIAVGHHHSCAIMSNYAVWCWGDNSLGQLGIGSFGNACISSTGPESSGYGVKISAGSNHSYKLISNGIAMGWGSDSGGQLDLCTFSFACKPYDGNKKSALSVNGTGSQHTCIVHVDGEVQCWGLNSKRQVFNEYIDKTFCYTSEGKKGDIIPVKPSVNLEGVVDITAGNQFNCALLDDSSVKCWGANEYGQLGNGQLYPHTGIPQIVDINSVSSIDGGGRHICTHKGDGTVWCWGDNSNGQLGQGATPAKSPTPLQVSGISNSIAVSCGEYHSCALMSDSSIWCWGANGKGQLGDGTTVWRDTPVQVSGFSGAIAVSAGLSHTCALKADDSIWCWGNNANGQVGDGTLVDRWLPVQVQGVSQPD